MGLHVVLYQPEIPANTGNIARTCAATNTTLHLIRPLGFSTDDKMLKRAGLDYWKYANVVYHDSLDELFEAHPKGQFFYITKFGQKQHTTFDYSQLDEDYFFVFGRETSGLPKDLIEQNMDRCLRLPMTEHVRSLNLSNTAAILVYEALRQQQYRDLI
ncbi:tRNA (uridine(34)/cytosine(34)/5-carboxymethylaminomethyluridine(34)-2'-O)-methyltransferase TrmL [Bacillus safensis]|uniref:tRNA (uridine(34)/cytosine(34)/5- carboxymethylaminomethyluridine(34)-2'-O)- methyltransferase TrmL n=1 Tax=Bacillus safensis TaxID=561879 RepID=UPI0009095453|nr:tRNA (uridine(34)/cytosine(34)/5-carboxymethylaminomethyluridine(34)-2'-O)-methyltransferase TrmL [Bacillus safensis]APJ10248.1 tRNA (uridine(34)/cytosine(34)/5-carboxymethylaminomethyluridine(34)-2'-O)-methyltransferase TrmL [Bacillus safensis]WHX76222.1 tRNA (uridine(34)/cytosine(34)/5-carboxymethylaminomethyluridine(34)-2'-O)-methyltransferase TrmL [Bacillus safensis]WHX83681.1 tRNA (uridine(34)/cytosine(34)/5-carboxymethylaminomethyluridine(34)-2'-O)-methyltransferase TrmL [Bacillus safen